MDSRTLRQKFLQYFKAGDHKVIPSASLVPENDPTVLFTTAGMQPLVPYLLGEKHPAGKRLCDLQKCIRTGDIDEVGDDTHLTFFEMMGYWSLGDYWKKEAINFTFEFVTKELEIPVNNLAVTCFEGDSNNKIDRDTESAEIWQSLGIPEKRIAFLGYEDNFWGPAGVEGPCGPDTEIFVWRGQESVPEEFDPNDKNWMEIGNDVFMAYNKNSEGKFEPLSQRNVDFGAGYERILAYIEVRSNVYETELFEPILREIEQISGKKYEDNIKEFRIIADHIKAATFAINDGANPSNKDAGYVVRRLIRRAIVKAHQIGVSENFTVKVAKKIFEIYDGVYFGAVIPAKAGIQASKATQLPGSPGTTLKNIAGPEDDKKKGDILAELEKEESKFRQTLKNGLVKLEILSKLWAGFSGDLEKRKLMAKDIFDLYQSDGFPVELSLEIAKEKNIEISNETIEQYNNLMKAHQELSRTASAGMFKGGLADAGEVTTKYHTATHLLNAALRQVLGDGVFQKGSNITPERMRFDFSYAEKMTPEEIKKTEDLVNEQIAADLPVSMTEMTVDEAKAQGAIGVFDSKYGEKVKVYSIGPNSSTPDGRSEPPFSREICGGPHVEHTGVLGHFKIVKEESSSAGVRRIKAVLE